MHFITARIIRLVQCRNTQGSVAVASPVRSSSMTLVRNIISISSNPILSVIPKLKETDPNLMDAALDLGVKPFKALRKVIVPAITAGIFSGMLLAFTMSIDDFVISYYTTGNGFDNLSIWVYGSMGRKSLTPSVYAFSTLLTLFTMLTMIGYQSFQRKGRKKHEKH